MRSISLKVTLLYIFLAVLNISLFTIFIFENQIDLITENTKYKSESLAVKLYSLLDQVQKEQSLITVSTAEDTAREIRLKIEAMKLVPLFVLFKEDGTILEASNKDYRLESTHLTDAARAIANKDFTGQFYYSRIVNEPSEILFYIPFKLSDLENLILFFKMDLNEINEKIDILYQFVGIIIGFITFFHIMFGVFLNMILIKPIKRMAFTSDKISSGDLQARIGIVRRDEIGKLSSSFDLMAESIQDKINVLNKKNTIMSTELEMASLIQGRIYPELRKTDSFDVAIYHKPLIEVSGDYHDIFELGDGKYGFLIADVSGHGVSAALITLLIKDIFQKSACKFKVAGDLMKYVNDEMNDLMDKYDKYFTAFYFILDSQKRVSFSNAGHHPAFLIRPGSNKVYEMDAEGVLLGFGNELDDANFESKRYQLESKDKIVLFTDGITEAVNVKGNAYENTGLAGALYKHHSLNCMDMLTQVLYGYNKFIDTANRSDDETIMIIELK